jgi:hypothetical protein
MLAELELGLAKSFLSALYIALSKIRVEKCPFLNLPATGRTRWGQGLSAAEMRRRLWVKPVMMHQVKVHRVDAR